MTDVAAKKWIAEQAREAGDVRDAVAAMSDQLADVAAGMAQVFRNGGRVIFFGNGGSAADAQHWAAELSGRFYMERPSLPALALTTNTSQITAIANDYGFENTFARPLRALAQKGDMAVGISTSGRSANVLRALKAAREIGCVTVGFTGAGEGELRPLCDELISIPSEDVARIQEGHELCAHLIFSVVERVLYGSETANKKVV